MFFVGSVVAAAIGCNPTEPGVTTETTVDPTTEATSAGPTTTTSESSTGEPTSEPPTTGTSTSGDSESATGTTGDSSSSGSTGPLTGDEGSSSSSTGDESSTGTVEPPTPVSFAECRQGDATMCPSEDPACLVVDGPGGGGGGGSFFVTWSYCSRECDEDADCVSELAGGTAKALCVPKGPNDVKVCVLDCSFGKTCPGALECSDDNTCGTRFCDCNGDGCQDFLCTGD